VAISVSLVTPVYNRADYLPAAIESILLQTHSDFELLIWDDGSADNSVAIATHYAQYDKRIRVVAATHQGQTRSLKAAIAQTSAPYVAWVDSDDLLAPTALAETVKILNANPSVGLVYTDYHVIDANGTLQGMGNRCKIPYSPKRLLVDFMLFHFRLMRRTAYDQVGGLDPTFVRAQDYDLCLKLSEVTDIFHLSEPLYYYRAHAQSVSEQQRIEQILWSKQAIENAIQRRGMADDYELEMEIIGRHILRRRPT
jgi:glycosyltransferase involved in cell wall biosynthesis